MQMSVPDVMDIRQEPASILEMYGAQPGAASFANNCLLARRLVERGVRYVQLFDWGWDCHGTGKRRRHRRPPAPEVQGHRPADRGPAQGPQAARAARRDTRRLGRRVRPDLDERGPRRLEVPRPRPPPALLHPLDGRRRHQAGDLPRRDRRPGLQITENPVTVHDLQATILHLLGLDAENLRFPYQGLHQRLIGVEGDGHVRKELLA